MTVRGKGEGEKCSVEELGGNKPMEDHTNSKNMRRKNSK